MGFGCLKCGFISTASKRVKSVEKFIEEAKKIYGNFYDYSKVVYKNEDTRICIICPEHGEFCQTPYRHLYNRGCPLCYKINKRKDKIIDFINKSNKIHNNRYDYFKSEYVDSSTKLCITCKIHGDFFQSPNHHLKGQGCPECGKILVHKKIRSNTEEFIKKSLKVHGNKYDYSHVNYYGNNKKEVCIICKIHGEFFQVANTHLSGFGCKLCGIFLRTKNMSLSLESFIERAVKTHGDRYAYSDVKYENRHKKIDIICKEHGKFSQTPSDHIEGSGCPKCGILDRIKIKTFSLSEFIKRAKDVHGDIYDYSKVKYIESRSKVKIVCSKHGEFLQTPHLHMQGSGCPVCIGSRGERLISRWFIKNNIPYYPQYTYKDLKGRGHRRRMALRFDFYVPHKNLLIEFDGTQHFKLVRFNGMSLDKAIKNFDNIKANDSLKNEYCTKNSIPLLRIPYTDVKKIPEILSENLLYR
jgi:very-short-patch-repair endonuclease/phage FluMu protein Com